MTSRYTKAYQELIDAGISEVHLNTYIQKQQRNMDTSARFKEITAYMADLHDRKNKDYGNSFDKSLDEDGLLVAKIRLGDKFSRFAQLIKHEAQVRDESIRDTLIDNAVYAIKTVMWMDLQEEKKIEEQLVKQRTNDDNMDAVSSALRIMNGEKTLLTTDNVESVLMVKDFIPGSNAYSDIRKDSGYAGYMLEDVFQTVETTGTVEASYDSDSEVYVRALHAGADLDGDIYKVFSPEDIDKLIEIGDKRNGD